MKYETVKMLSSRKAKALYQQHCVQGGAEWITINGERVSRVDLEAYYAPKNQKHINTDIGEQDEDMGTALSDGDPE